MSKKAQEGDWMFRLVIIVIGIISFLLVYSLVTGSFLPKAASELGKTTGITTKTEDISQLILPEGDSAAITITSYDFYICAGDQGSYDCIENSELPGAVTYAQKKSIASCNWSADYETERVSGYVFNKTFDADVITEHTIYLILTTAESVYDSSANITVFPDINCATEGRLIFENGAEVRELNSTQTIYLKINDAARIANARLWVNLTGTGRFSVDVGADSSFEYSFDGQIGEKVLFLSETMSKYMNENYPSGVGIGEARIPIKITIIGAGAKMQIEKLRVPWYFR